MASINQNPYRVLDLFANSSEREILREVRRITSFIDIGREIQDKNSFPLIGKMDRTLEIVESSRAAIEQPAEKIIHALFWFVNITEWDESAFEALRSGDLDRAASIWKQVIADADVDEVNFSAFANLSTLLLWEACERESFDLLAFEESMELRGHLLSASAFADLADEVGFRQMKSVEEDVLPKYLESLEEYLEPFMNKSLGLSTSDLANALSSFPGGAGEAILENIVEQPLSTVQNAVKKAREDLENDEWDADNIGLELFDRTRKEIVALKSAFGEHHFRFVMAINEVSGMLLNCSIAFFNTYQKRFEIDPGPGALLLLDYAKSLRPGEEIRERIRVNEPVIREWVTGSAGRKRLKNVRDNAKRIYDLRNDTDGISSSSDAFEFLQDCDKDLYRIEKELGADDPEYLRFADMVINHAINGSIAGVNRTQGIVNNLVEQANGSGFEPNAYLLERARVAYDIYKAELQRAYKVISRAKDIKCSDSMSERIEENEKVLHSLLSGVQDFGRSAPKRPSADDRKKDKDKEKKEDVESDGPLEVDDLEKKMPNPDEAKQSSSGMKLWIAFLIAYIIVLLIWIFVSGKS